MKDIGWGIFPIFCFVGIMLMVSILIITIMDGVS